jgi:dolichol-phosphate mannosyltransferase
MMPYVDIIIPVYNEGGNILIAIQAIREKVCFPYGIRIIYDFEEDTTLPELKKLDAEMQEKVIIVRNIYGRGVLNAIKTGIVLAKSELVIVTMADLSDPPEVMNRMVEEAVNQQADIVCASRYMKGGKQIGGPLLKGVLSQTAGCVLHYFAGVPTHDATNSFKLYRKSFLDTVQIESSGGFEIGIELVAKAFIKGKKIVETPTIWTDRVDGKSNFKLWKWLPNYLKWFFYCFRLS